MRRETLLPTLRHYLQHEEQRWQEHIDKINTDVSLDVGPTLRCEVDRYYEADNMNKSCAKSVQLEEGQRMPLSTYTSLLQLSPEEVAVARPLELDDSVEYVELGVHLR